MFCFLQFEAKRQLYLVCSGLGVKYKVLLLASTISFMFIILKGGTRFIISQIQSLFCLFWILALPFIEIKALSMSILKVPPDFESRLTNPLTVYYIGTEVRQVCRLHLIDRISPKFSRVHQYFLDPLLCSTSSQQLNLLLSAEQQNTQQQQILQKSKRTECFILVLRVIVSAYLLLIVSQQRKNSSLMRRQNPNKPSTPLDPNKQIPIKRKLKADNSFQIHSVTSELKVSPPSTSELNQEMHHKYELELKELIQNFQDYGQVIRLAYIANNNQVHIDQETLYFLQKYSTFQIAFISFIGEKQSGKSFAIDTILNLSSAQGNQFFASEREKGIYLWTIPFTTNYKRKIFVLELSGVTYQTQLGREEQIFVDLIHILSSTIIVVNPVIETPQNEAKKKRNPIFQRQTFTNPLQSNVILELRKSSERILKQNEKSNQSDSYWPQMLHSLSLSKATPLTQIYAQLYSFCTFSDLPPPFPTNSSSNKQKYTQSLNNKLYGMSSLYIDKLSETFLQLIDKTTTKQYQNLKYTGNICCKLLINSIKYLNKKQKIKINKIFASILKELYQSSYEYHTDLYDDYLKEYFGKEEALSYDDLLQAFQLSSTYAVESFNQIVIQQKLHKQYQDKLLTYIDNKQELIIEINSKKTKNTLKDKLKIFQIEKTTDIDSIKSLLHNLKIVHTHLDHNRCYIIADRLLKYTNNIEKRILEERQRYQRQKIASLKQEKKEEEEYLKMIYAKNQQKLREKQQNQRKQRQLLKKQTNLQNTTKSCKKQIQIQKRYQKEYIVSKQSKRQYAQSLLQIMRQKQQKVRENCKQIEQINKQYEYHPTIMLLQKKIQEKGRQIRELQVIQSKIEMQSRLSALQSKTSIMRSAIQKPKEQKPVNKPIKKLTTKK